MASLVQLAQLSDRHGGPSILAVPCERRPLGVDLERVLLLGRKLCYRDLSFVTSPATPQYNCIAWAAGDDEKVWWPHQPPLVSYWPPGVPRVADLTTFKAAFATLGYAPCADGAIEPGFEKVGLFADAHGRPTHAAKQLSNGRWSSKLGANEDISHHIYGLEGASYGDVVQYLKRKPPPAGP